MLQPIIVTRKYVAKVPVLEWTASLCLSGICDSHICDAWNSREAPNPESSKELASL